jgi:hypothetical protein
MVREERTHALRRPPAPLCPACGDAMALIRVIPRGGYLCEQHIFECRACSIALTQAPELER